MSTDRHAMVAGIKKEYGLDSPKILDVMVKIPRDEFTPERFRDIAYEDHPIDIGYGQTMSQPFTVAKMTCLATEFPISNFQIPNKLKIPNSKFQKTYSRKGKVLEIGTGSGYQAAILSYFFDKVYTIEIVPQLAKQAGETLKKLGYKNVYVKAGSGERGWKKMAPFDSILITAGMEEVPDELFEQLKTGGVLVAPVGKGYDKVMTRFIKFKTQRLKLKTATQNSKLKERKNRERNKISIGNFNFWVDTFGTFHFVPFV